MRLELSGPARELAWNGPGHDWAILALIVSFLLVAWGSVMTCKHLASPIGD